MLFSGIKLSKVLPVSWQNDFLTVFFTDDCAGQFNNCKKLYNLCQIPNEYHLEGEWNFATL